MIVEKFEPHQAIEEDEDTDAFLFVELWLVPGFFNNIDLKLKEKKKKIHSGPKYSFLAKAIKLMIKQLSHKMN